MSDRLPILCVDFDGVLHRYRGGGKGADVVSDCAVDGAMNWLVTQAVPNFEVHVFSSRSHQPGGINAMRGALLMWLTEECGSDGAAAFLKLQFPNVKPPAMLAIDDRGVTFTGEWSDFSAERMKAFRPWNVGGGQW